MTWTVQRTDTFLDSLKVFKKNGAVLAELEKKILRLQEDPLNTGGWLSGVLQGKKSTRIGGKYRLIFTPVEEDSLVYLNLIDHREKAYED